MVTKPLSERIADRLNKKKETSGAGNKAVFLALKNDIEEAIEAGWSLKQIFQTLTDEQKITFTYETFRKYANKIIHKEKKSIDVELDSSQSETPEKPQNKSSFSFDSKPKKENLV